MTYMPVSDDCFHLDVLVTVSQPPSDSYASYRRNQYLPFKFPRELQEAENFEEACRFLYQWRLLEDVMRYVTDPNAQYLILAVS